MHPWGSLETKLDLHSEPIIFIDQSRYVELRPVLGKDPDFFLHVVAEIERHFRVGIHAIGFFILAETDARDPKRPSILAMDIVSFKEPGIVVMAELTGRT